MELGFITVVVVVDTAAVASYRRRRSSLGPAMVDNDNTALVLLGVVRVLTAL
jgi:hypothetical protein